MLRAVLDPGVLIAAVISPRAAPAALVRAWRRGAFELVVSQALLDELLSVLLRPKFRRYLSEDQARELVRELQLSAGIEMDPADPPAATRDRKDDYLVALAAQGKVDVLVSGDRDVLESPNPPVHVMTPRIFLERLRVEAQEEGSG